MKLEKLNREIIETIQEIGMLFFRKGIVAAPFDIRLMDSKDIPEGMERIIILELLMHLEDLCKIYYKGYKKPHRYKGYIRRFYITLDLNTTENTLISTNTEKRG